VSSVLRPHQHSIGYTGDSFYRVARPDGGGAAAAVPPQYSRKIINQKMHGTASQLHSPSDNRT